MRDYKYYTQEMKKPMEEKLFFKDMIDFDTLIDFGCGDGSLLQALSAEKPDVSYFGYDHDPVMVESAENNCIYNKNIFCSNSLMDIDMQLSYDTDKLVMNYSSVLHELCTFSRPGTLDTEMALDVFEPKYITVRDMYANPKVKLSKEEISVIRTLETKVKNAVGYPSVDLTLLEDLIKNKFLNGPNAELESKERYFSFMERESEILAGPYELIYSRNYCLPFYRKEFSSFLGTDFNHITHTQRIYKRTW